MTEPSRVERVVASVGFRISGTNRHYSDSVSIWISLILLLTKTLFSRCLLSNPVLDRAGVRSECVMSDDLTGRGLLSVPASRAPITATCISNFGKKILFFGAMFLATLISRRIAEAPSN